MGTTSRVYSAPAVSNGIVYITSDFGGNVYAVNASTGTGDG
ncbi:PQQ-binding-like beta-propeller repeat protein [Alloacidobacterium sp.]